MKETLESIREGLRRNSFINEASVSQGIVLRLLRELGWDTFDVDAVSPEYSVKGRRVDFALCHPRNKPQVFIEVKQVGKSVLDFEEQLAAYAFEEGVPLVVLTTGKEWNFYVPYGPGRFTDRRVYRIDLLERSVEEIADRMERYLAFDTVRSGDFTSNAQNDLRDVLSAQETRRQLPKAWSRLLEEPSPALVELLLQELESITGDTPQLGVVESFLRERASTQKLTGHQPGRLQPEAAPAADQPGTSRRPSPLSSLPDPHASNVGHLYLSFAGQDFQFGSHRQRLIKLFQLLMDRDVTFLERFANEARPGRRPGIARTPRDLFPRNPALAGERSHYAEIQPRCGWYIDVNQSGSQMESMIRKACRVAGLTFGTDVRVGQAE